MGRIDIDARRTVPAPPPEVFAALYDRTTWPSWSGHASFESVTPGKDGLCDVGSVGLLRSGRRRVMREEIVEVVPGRRIGYVLLAGLPVRDYRADFTLTPAGSGTEVRWHARFQASPVLGWILTPALRRFSAGMLQGLDRHVREHGSRLH